MSGRNLLVGFHLCDQMTQIAIYNPNTFSVELIGSTEENPDGILETAATIPGTERKLEHFFEKIQKGQKIIADGKEVDYVNLLAYYFRKTLSLTKKVYPDQTIRKLVITVEERSQELTMLIYEALEKLGIEKDRALVINYKQSYLYFVLCQGRELWLNDVGMFDYSDRGLFYYQLNIERRGTPILVGVTVKDYTAQIQAAEESDSEVEKETIFENVALAALHRKIISTLYMTGNGFQGEWNDEVFQRLLTGRRLFKGNNLFVSGACYAAREFGGFGKLEEFVYLDEEMIRVHITTKVYTNAQEREIILAKAGTPWYQVDREFELIPDGEDELPIHIRDVLKRESKTQMITLEGINGREKRMVRLGVRVRFTSANVCVITIKDKGFGDFMPSSNRIWEKVLTID